MAIGRFELSSADFDQTRLQLAQLARETLYDGVESKGDVLKTVADRVNERPRVEKSLQSDKSGLVRQVRAVYRWRCDHKVSTTTRRR